MTNLTAARSIQLVKGMGAAVNLQKLREAGLEGNRPQHIQCAVGGFPFPAPVGELG